MKSLRSSNKSTRLRCFLGHIYIQIYGDVCEQGYDVKGHHHFIVCICVILNAADELLRVLERQAVTGDVWSQEGHQDFGEAVGWRSNERNNWPLL